MDASGTSPALENPGRSIRDGWGRTTERRGRKGFAKDAKEKEEKIELDSFASSA